MTTPADLLVRGLGLPPLAVAPQDTPPGTACVVTGQPIARGYPAAFVQTGATAEFLDTFGGNPQGWVSETAAICFKNADPRQGNPTARAVMVFEDGSYYNPLIARESARKQDRPCWSELVRQVWPARAGQRVLIILTTDMKKRLWPRARVGVLGLHTPVLLYDADANSQAVLSVNWPKLLECLDVVEDAYSVEFSKPALREGVLSNWKTVERIGLKHALEWERALGVWRDTAEFSIAALIAQKKESNGSFGESADSSI